MIFVAAKDELETQNLSSLDVEDSATHFKGLEVQSLQKVQISFLSNADTSVQNLNEYLLSNSQKHLSMLELEDQNQLNKMKIEVNLEKSTLKALSSLNRFQTKQNAIIVLLESSINSSLTNEDSASLSHEYSSKSFELSSAQNLDSNNFENLSSADKISKKLTNFMKKLSKNLKDIIKKEADYRSEFDNQELVLSSGNIEKMIDNENYGIEITVYEINSTKERVCDMEKEEVNSFDFERKERKNESNINYCLFNQEEYFNEFMIAVHELNSKSSVIMSSSEVFMKDISSQETLLSQRSSDFLYLNEQEITQFTKKIEKKQLHATKKISNQEKLRSSYNKAERKISRENTRKLGLENSNLIEHMQIKLEFENANIQQLELEDVLTKQHNYKMNQVRDYFIGEICQNDGKSSCFNINQNEMMISNIHIFEIQDKIMNEFNDECENLRMKAVSELADEENIVEHIVKKEKSLSDSGLKNLENQEDELINFQTYEYHLINKTQKVLEREMKKTANYIENLNSDIQKTFEILMIENDLSKKFIIKVSELRAFSLQEMASNEASTRQIQEFENSLMEKNLMCLSLEENLNQDIHLTKTKKIKSFCNLLSKEEKIRKSFEKSERKIMRENKRKLQAEDSNLSQYTRNEIELQKICIEMLETEVSLAEEICNQTSDINSSALRKFEINDDYCREFESFEIKLSSNWIAILANEESEIKEFNGCTYDLVQKAESYLRENEEFKRFYEIEEGKLDALCLKQIEMQDSNTNRFNNEEKIQM